MIGIIVIIISISGIVIYLETSIDKVLSEEKQSELFNIINSTPDLPENFYYTIDKYYPDYFKYGVWDAIFQKTFSQEISRVCQCFDIYLHPGYVDNAIRAYQYILAMEIEENCSQKKCFEYNLSMQSFGFNIRGVNQAAEVFYNKNLEELTEREILELLVIRKAPTNYNPIKNRINLDKAVDRIINNKVYTNYGQVNRKNTYNSISDTLYLPFDTSKIIEMMDIKYSKTSKIQLDSIDTLRLRYTHFACDCPNWTLSKFYNDSFDSQNRTHNAYYLEAISDEIKIDPRICVPGNEIIVSGKLKAEFSLPENTEFTDPKPFKGKVFSYNSYKVVFPILVYGPLYHTKKTELPNDSNELILYTHLKISCKNL